MSDWSAPNIIDILLELIGGIHKSWPKNGQLSATVLSVKYIILHKICLTNWTPLFHGFDVSPPLENLLFQLGTGVHFVFGTVVYDQLMRHANSFAVKLPIYLMRLICGLLVSQHPKILTSKHVDCLCPHLLDFNFSLYKSNHVTDLCILDAEIDGVSSSDKVMIDDIPSRNMSLIWKTLKRA